jgi:hypothetical protein
MDNGATGNAALVGIFGALTYDIVAAACSSPQTTEINASTRADTLMKWVHLGLGQAAIFTVLGVALQANEGKAIWPPLVGSALGGGLMYASYVHAKKSGLESNEPGTEENADEYFTEAELKV